MAVASSFVPTEYVSPQKWKRHFGLTSDKDESRRAASRLLPKSAHLWARVKDDGRAEAALLAIYGARTADLQQKGLAA
jgi:crossover junction endodeoxyribonuclease RuvC